MYYDFIRYQYILGNLDTAQVNKLAENGYITAEQAAQITEGA